MKSCTKCTSSETADTLSFRADGTCSVCVQHETKHTVVDWDAQRAKLEQLADEARGSGDYDLIVPASFGKDSAFQVTFMMRELKLRPLVVRVNHHLYRPGTIENTLRAQRALGFDMIEFTPSWKVWREVAVEALRRRGDFCWPCHCSIFTYPLKVALEKRIQLVAWGETLQEYQSWGLGFDETVDEYRFNRATNLGITADDMFQFLGGRFERRELEAFAYPSSKALAELGVKSLCLGSYLKWDTKANTDYIKREIGWEEDRNEGIPEEFAYEKQECRGQKLRDFCRWLKRGQGRGSHLANIEIRQGRMTRERGMEMARAVDGYEPASLAYMLNLLALTRDEFYEIMAQHVVDPWEMPDPATIPKSTDVPHDMSLWP